MERITINIDNAIAQTQIRGKTLEETRRWKIEKKSLYSIRYPRKTLNDLKQKFPEGKIENDKFIVDKINADSELVRSLYDERGYEVQRSTYGVGISSDEVNKDKSLESRTSSIYDEDGYLIGVIEIHAGGKGGYIREITYEQLEVDLKENTQYCPAQPVKVPKYMLTQDVLANPNDKSLTRPGWPISWSPPIILSFTDVPYVKPPPEIGQ